MARVLIVEDDSDVRMLISRILQHTGHTTLAAAHGTAGLLLAHQEQPDLIVIDLTLRAINVFAAIRHLKAEPRTAHIPVIAITVAVRPDEEARARAAGCDGFMTKPLDIARFTALVAALTGRSRSFGGSFRPR